MAYLERHAISLSELLEKAIVLLDLLQVREALVADPCGTAVVKWEIEDKFHARANGHFAAGFGAAFLKYVVSSTFRFDQVVADKARIHHRLCHVCGVGQCSRMI